MYRVNWCAAAALLVANAVQPATADDTGKTLASKASPQEYGRLAAAQVRALLSTQGALGKDRNVHMHEINALLTNGGAADLNATLANLSNADLQNLAGNLNHGMVLGVQGLNATERGALYQQIAIKADATQTVRLMAAMEGMHPQAGSATMGDLSMLTVAVGKFSSPEKQNAVLAQLSQMPQFKAISQMNQYTGPNGQPIWDVPVNTLGINGKPLSAEARTTLGQERRFALASILIQAPSTTPASFSNAQNMASLSLAAYTQHPVGAGQKPGLPPGFPSDYKVVKNYSDPSSHSLFKATLFENERNNTYTLAFTGTDQKVEYVNTNLPQGAGEPTAQYTEAINLAISLKHEYGDRLTDITGHSLGGGLAAAAGMATGTRTTTFDAAGVNPKTMQMNDAPWNPSVVTNYDVQDELLGRVQNYYPTHYLAPKAVGTQITVQPFINDSMQTEPQLSENANAQGLKGSLVGHKQSYADLHSQLLIVPAMLGPIVSEFTPDWPGYTGPQKDTARNDGPSR
jgi:hypothetical protein